MGTGGDEHSWMSDKWGLGGWAEGWFRLGRKTQGCSLDHPEESTLPELSHKQFVE